MGFCADRLPHGEGRAPEDLSGLRTQTNPQLFPNPVEERVMALVCYQHIYIQIGRDSLYHQWSLDLRIP